MELNEAEKNIVAKIRALIAGLYDSRFAAKMYDELNAIEGYMEETNE